MSMFESYSASVPSPECLGTFSFLVAFEDVFRFPP